MTEEQRKLVEENHNLIYYYLHKHGLSIDEYYDLGAIGLCKAAITYKDDISEFSTYAMKCISNEIGGFIRSCHYARTIPDNLIVYTCDITNESSDGDELIYGDFLADSVNIEDEVIAKMSVENMLTSLSDREREILLLRMDGMDQADIAKHIGISQPHVSRILNKLKRRI